MCFGIKRKCNEQDNEAETSQHNMQTKDERSDFQSKPPGVSYLRKGEQGRGGRAERRPKGGGVGGVSIPEFLCPPPHVSAPLPPVTLGTS